MVSSFVCGAADLCSGGSVSLETARDHARLEMYAHGLSTRDIEALFADEDGRSLRSSYRAVLDRSSARERGCAALPARGSSQGSTEIAQRLSENEDRLQGL